MKGLGGTLGLELADAVKSTTKAALVGGDGVTDFLLAGSEERDSDRVSSPVSLPGVVLGGSGMGAGGGLGCLGCNRTALAADTGTG